jgi:hypothetical protein
MAQQMHRAPSSVSNAAESSVAEDVITRGDGTADAAAGVLGEALSAAPPLARQRQDSMASAIDGRAGTRRRPVEPDDIPLEQSEQLQAELEECLDAIRWCATSVTRESLFDVRNTQKPAPVVKDVIETVALLLGQPETRWDKLKRFIGSPTFMTGIQTLNLYQKVTREQFRKLRERLAHPDFDEELVKTVCVPVVPLAMWCRAIGVYLSKTKYRGGPAIRPVAAAGGVHQLYQRPCTAEQRRTVAPGTCMVFDPDIEQLTLEELQHVLDLTISRQDVGEITFHGETDCTALDFEQILRLEIGEVLVYPDSSSKPPVGMGLNKAATVTMYQCWPPNGSTLLQDAKSQEKYKNKIRHMTEEKHAKFIDYDCSTGIWKFSVEHF